MQVAYAHSLLTFHLNDTQLLAFGCTLESIENFIEGYLPTPLCQELR
jgi:hypothetical protein